MSLDEAIKYTEEVVKKYEKKLEMYENIEDKDKLLFIEEETECRLCTSELQQLAEWLKELKALRKSCTSKAFDMAIEALGQTDVLDKIRAEIEQLASRYTISRERGGMGQVEWADRLIKESEVMQILDKYKAESEDKE